ncbi:MAG: phosphatidate cytidylyltransferase [Burkholderiales bacterium]|nr:phosphatidate cytidylyltransferase [Burkholderiales bacterium]
MLKTRILTALLLLPVVLACLFLGPPVVWGSFALIALAIGGWEWSRLARFDRGEMLVFVSGFLAVGLAWLFLPIAQSWALLLDVYSLAFWLVLAPLWLARKWTLRHKWLAALVGWLLLLAALVAVTRFRELHFAQMPRYGGPVTLLFVLAIAWVADIAAYFAGRAFGRKKLAPSISPGKTWEGVYGAVLAVAIYLFVLRQCNMPLFASIPLVVLIPLGVSLTAVSIVGDLLESLLKRQAGIKDSSNLLPGHGGVLDRIDSLLALAPVSSALLYAAALAYHYFS